MFLGGRLSQLALNPGSLKHTVESLESLFWSYDYGGLRSEESIRMQ